MLYNSSMTAATSLTFYRFLTILLSPIILLRLLIEAYQQQSWTILRSRLGHSKAISADHWFHCASVGEVNAIAPVILALQLANKKILLTTFTPTGLEQANRRFSHLCNIQTQLLPIDWQWTISHFLKQINCPKLTLVETEFWPNLMSLAHQKGIQISVVNARLTHKTLQSPRWWKGLLVNLLDHHVQQILCRSVQDERDFKALGLSGQHLSVVGNLKWCDQSYAKPEALILKPYVLLASSHAPEEIELARHWQAHPELPALVLVPRHPKRGDDIARELKLAGIAFSQRSQQPHIQNRVLLADTFGELLSWIAHAELVIMGGSFAPKGGQNPLEAIRLGKLVLSGPDMRDFAEEADQLARLQAMIQVKHYDELFPLIQHYLAHPAIALFNVQRAQAWLLNCQTGILDRVITALESNHELS